MNHDAQQNLQHFGSWATDEIRRYEKARASSKPSKRKASEMPVQPDDTSSKPMLQKSSKRSPK